jgi:hypothetical protein
MAPQAVLFRGVIFLDEMENCAPSANLYVLEGHNTDFKASLDVFVVRSVMFGAASIKTTCGRSGVLVVQLSHSNDLED